MGGSASVIDSPIFDSVKTQFEKLRKGPHIHLEDLMRLELPVSIGRVEFMHLPVLFKMDENRDGKFSFQDVVTFSQFFNEEAKVFRDFEIGGRINGIACSEFAALCRSDRGVEFATKWVIRLITSVDAPVHDPSSVHRESIMLLFKLLSQIPGFDQTDLNFFQFFKLLKLGEKELGIANSDCDAVAEVVLEDKFLKPFLHVCLTTEIADRFVEILAADAIRLGSTSKRRVTVQTAALDFALLI